MGCAASTSTAQPGYPAAVGGALAAQRQQQQQQRPSLPVAQVNQLRLQREEAAKDAVKGAPVVKSLVSLQREGCSLERDNQGCHLLFHLSALAPGEATLFFLASGSDLGGSFETPDAKQVLSHRFEAGRVQSCRLFLCTDLKQRLEEFGEEKDAQQLVLDLRVDAQKGPQRCITAQRSLIKFLEGDSLQVTKQIVQCGQAVRCLDALYGTLPTPAGAPREAVETTTSDADGGDCVICLSKPREVAILHCRHVCLCMSCAQITSSTWSHQCPVCRGQVAAMVGLDQASRG